MARPKSVRRLQHELLEAEIAKRRAETAERAARATREGLAAALESGLSVGLGIWAGTRMNVVIGNAELTDNKNPLLDGIRRWVADRIGLVVGPVVAAAIPAGLADNGRFLANKYLQIGWQWWRMDGLGEDGTPDGPFNGQRMIEDVAREGWYTAEMVEAQPSEHGWPISRLVGLRFQDHVTFMIGAAVSLGMVGLIEAVKAAAGKVGG